MDRIKRISVVDGNLEIHSVEVSENEWKKEVHLGAKIGSQPIILRRGGWDELTTYAGFNTKKEAKAFRSLKRAAKKKAAYKPPSPGISV